MNIFIDNHSPIITNPDELAMRDPVNIRIKLARKSDTAFEVCSLRDENGGYLIRYDVDVARWRKGVLHTLRFVPTLHMHSLSEDRISTTIFQDVPPCAALKMELNTRLRGGNNNVVVFYVIPGTDDCVVLSRLPTYFENVEPIIADTNDVHELIARCYPQYEDPRPLNTLRLSALLALDPNDSLAYLEAQTDFLTRIVLAMVEQHPDLKLSVLDEVAEYANFKDAVAGNMVFGVKSDAKCLEEIRVNKAAARQAQRAYYAGRAALGAAKEMTHGHEAE